MSETLTEADRDRLDQKGERKALRIIDAQATALARVRGLVTDVDDSLLVRVAHIREALSGSPAAPEAGVIKAPEVPTYAQLFGMVSELQTSERGLKRDLAAANARADLAVRHVRYQQDEIRICLDDRNEASRRMNEANARADAAERKLYRIAELTQERDHWESNSAALRAELAATRAAADQSSAAWERARDEAVARIEAAERNEKDWRESDALCQARNEKLRRENAHLEQALARESDELGEEFAKLQRAEAEAAALRAEVARLTREAQLRNTMADATLDELDATETRLAAATALLERGRRGKTQLARDADAFLAANPVSPRAAAERAVLDAMGDVDEDTLRDRLKFRCLTLEDRAVYTAELARRAVKP